MASLRTGGSSMLSIGWPLGGIFMVIFTASIAEFGSAYPVSGLRAYRSDSGSSHFRISTVERLSPSRMDARRASY